MSVCGTGTLQVCLADFLGSWITGSVTVPRRGQRTFGLQLGTRTSLRPSTPLTFNGDFRRPAAVSLLRPRIALKGSNGILTVSAIGIGTSLSLRTRLTPG